MKHLIDEHGITSEWSTDKLLTVHTDTIIYGDLVVLGSISGSCLSGSINSSFITGSLVTNNIDTGSFAPFNAPYLILSSSDLNLSEERILTRGAGIGILDNGPGNTYVVSCALTGGPNISINTLVNNSIAISASNVAPNTATYLVLSNDSNLINEKIVSAGPGIVFNDINGILGISASLVSGPNINISTQSNGSIVISNSYNISSGSVTSGSIATELWNMINEKIYYLDTTGGSSQYYSAPPTIMKGASNFIVACILRPEFRQSETADSFLLTGNGTTNGWGISLSNDVLTATVGTTLGAVSITINSITNGYIGAPGYKYQRDIVLLMQVYLETNTKMNLWANGGKLANTSGLLGAVVEGTNNLTYIGRTIANTCGHGGFAYKVGTATDQEISSFFRACYEQRKLANQGIAWNYIWNVEDSVPEATWNSITGSVALVRSGSQYPIIAPKVRWA